MKPIIIAVMVLSFGVLESLAADTMIFPSKSGNITFNHKRHVDFLKDCRNCHEKTPGKIANFGKDYAHKTCKGCHELRGLGPTKCNACHRK